MIVFYYILFLLWMVFRAFWEKSAFDEGESLHIFKYLELLVSFSIPFLIYFEKTWRKMLTVLLGLTSMHLAGYDYILNSLRGLELGYKTNDIINLIGFALWIICFIVYFKIDKYG